MNKNQQNNLKKQKNQKGLLLSTKLMLLALLGCIVVITYYVIHFGLFNEVFAKKQDALNKSPIQKDVIQHTINTMQKTNDDNNENDSSQEVDEDNKSLEEDEDDAEQQEDVSNEQAIIDHAKKLLPSLVQKQKSEINELAVQSDNGDLRKQLNSYNKFLLNIQYLIFNFVQEEDYSKYLRVLESKNLNLPDDIQIIISMLNRYNDQLKNTRSLDTKQIVFTNVPFLNKLITITKETHKSQKNKQLKADILNRIDKFLRYMYSKNVQSVFINIP